MVTSEVQSKKCFPLYINWNKGKNWDLQLFPEYSLHHKLDIVKRNGRSTPKSPLHISLRQDSSHLVPRGTTVWRCFTPSGLFIEPQIIGTRWILVHMRYGLRLSSSNYQINRKRFIGASPEKCSLLRDNCPCGQSRAE